MKALKRAVPVFLVLLFVFVAIPAETPQKEVHAQDDVDVDAVTEFIARLWNEGNLDDIETFVSPELYIHFLDIRPDQEGIDALVEWVMGVRTIIPDLEGEFVEQVAEEDLIVLLVHATGTHTGEVPGIPATGNEIVIDAIWMVRVEDGKITEWWQLEDLLNSYIQLGILPPLEAASEE